MTLYIFNTFGLGAEMYFGEASNCFGETSIYIGERCFGPIYFILLVLSCLKSLYAFETFSKSVSFRRGAFFALLSLLVGELVNRKDDVTLDFVVNGVVIGLLLLILFKVCWRVHASSLLNLVVFASFVYPFDEALVFPLA
jgi:hypothetical protein